MHGRSTFLEFSYRIKNRFVAQTFHAITSWVRHTFFCNRNLHIYTSPFTGQRYSRCLICNEELFPQVIISYEVTTHDGRCELIDAINEHHALSLFVKGRFKTTYLNEKGLPSGDFENHPNSVKSITDVGRKYMFKGKDLWAMDDKEVSE